MKKRRFARQRIPVHKKRHILPLKALCINKIYFKDHIFEIRKPYQAASLKKDIFYI